MTIDRIKGCIVFHCDGDCGESLETDTPDFQEAVEIAKAEGWVYALVDGEHTHTCKDCKLDVVY